MHAGYSSQRFLGPQKGVQPRASRLETRALFGGGKKEKKSQKQLDREEAFRNQEAILARRKDGSWLKKANDRRAEVRKYAGDPAYKEKIDAERRERRKKENPDPPINPFSIIIPVVPFGMPEYDDGERFDLRSPYAEKGYVDEDSAIGKKFARFFGLDKKKDGDNESKGKKKGGK